MIKKTQKNERLSYKNKKYLLSYHESSKINLV